MNVSVDQNSDKYRGEWQPTMVYYEGDMVIQNGILNVANSDFLSGGIFDQNNWTEVSCDGGECIGGGVPTGTIWDITHAGHQRITHVSLNGKTAFRAVLPASSVITTNTFYNTSRTDGVYFEISHNDYSSGVSFGLTWDRQYNGSSYLYPERLSVLLGETNRPIRLIRTGEPNIDYNSSLPNDDVNRLRYRFFIKGTKVWFGYRFNGVSSVLGDPSLGTGYVTDLLPAGTDVYPYADSVQPDQNMTIYTTQSSLTSDTLGFNSWDV